MYIRSTEASADYSPQFTVTSDGGTVIQASGTVNETSNEALDADETVSFTNTRDGNVPTGLVYHYWWILLLIGGSIAGFVMITKRRNHMTTVRKVNEYFN